MTSRKELLGQARRWIEQEQMWGSELYGKVKTDLETVEKRPVALKASTSTQVAEPRKTVASPVRPVAPAPLPAPRSAAKESALAALYEKYKDCTRCRLGLSRIKIVFGVGSASTEVLFIGEGPGFEEDHRGEPFVGKSGQLLDRIMASIGLSRTANAYIANIVKCHPMINSKTPEARGNDRPPAPDEVETCSPILLQQIAIIQPRVIVTLGSPSTKMVLRTKDAITQLRGKLAPFPVDEFYPESLVADPSNPLTLDASTRETLRRIQVLPTFHPAALLRNPNLKADTWTDMKLLRESLAQRS